MDHPKLNVIGLHIENCRSLKRLDWPADGLGWAGTVPDMVMVGGVNGSGKTTLLEFIAGAAAILGTNPYQFPAIRLPDSDWSSLSFGLRTPEHEFEVAVMGNAASVCAAASGALEGEERAGDFSVKGNEEEFDAVHATLYNALEFARSTMPGVVYLPTDRAMVIPPTSFKGAGQFIEDKRFYHRFTQPTEWSRSIEALLYAARWSDLNAKEEGRPTGYFEAYEQTFQVLYEGKRRLVWRGGELKVEVPGSGAIHDLNGLSSGEKQVLILAAELYVHWRPGSLILVDEPELHFHPHWQAKLWELLCRWQSERGGQVIVATQSSDLFQLAEPGSRLLLGRESLK